MSMSEEHILFELDGMSTAEFIGKEYEITVSPDALYLVALSLVGTGFRDSPSEVGKLLVQGRVQGMRGNGFDLCKG